jgi:hypothetical protein
MIMATMNLKVKLTRKRVDKLNGLINAVGFLRHKISKAFIGPGPAASTDFSELTPSAFSFIAVYISEILENLGGFPDLRKRFFSRISAVQFEVAAGLNLPDVRDEAERDPSQTTPRHGIQPMLLRSDLLALLLAPLPENTMIVRGTRGLELEGDSFPLLIKPVERFFVVEGRYLLILKLLPSSCGNQEEDVMSHCTEADSQLEDIGDQMEIDLGDGRIDLEFKARFLSQVNPPE